MRKVPQRLPANSLIFFASPFFSNLSWWRAGAGNLVAVVCVSVAITWLLLALRHARARAALEQRLQQPAAELEHKTQELALERAQHALDVRFRELLDAAPDAMVVTGSDGRISLVNVQAERLFGYTRTELIGTELELLIPERFRAVHRSHLERFFRQPSARPMGSGIALYGRRKDGSELPIEVSLSPLQTSEGVTVSAAVRDISERKRLEAATRLFAERLSSAVDSIEDAFALFDNQDRLVLCNGGYRKLVEAALPGVLAGRPYEELLEAFISQIAFASDEERTRFHELRMSQRGQATAPFDIKLRDGRSMRVSDRSTAEGGSVKTIWDLTEDVRLAEELRSARVAAEAASKAKSEFLSSMSHELRTPLNAILGFAQLLQRDKKEPLSERHRERVGRILKGGEHLLHLIDDILDLSRIEAGRVSLVIEPLSVADVLQQVKTTLEPLAASNEVQIRVDSISAILPLIAADATRYSQILLNFVSNAIKYNRRGGNVTFDVAKPETGWLRVIVRDSGVGIPADKQDKLFQAFQRAGQETGPVEGTGIGLFISKRLAELMHGDIGFRSSPGEGTEFWVDMPIYDLPSATLATPSLRAATSEASMPAETKKSILYIEDNPISVELMRDIIDSFDHIALVTAPSAELGLELARAQKPEIVLMDINLPGMNGLEAMKELRKLPELQHVPVIALSAAASARDRERGVEAGFYAYLTKPLNIDTFVVLIQQLTTPRQTD
jgi:PAS domain S-box-containing protein